MPKRRNFFYGDDGNNVDFAQRYAGSDMAGQNGTEQVVKAARRNSPPSVQNDPVKAKRLEDEIHGAMAGYDTTPEEDALLRQARPEADEYTEQAERMVRSMERNKEFGIPSGPEGRQQWVEDLAERLRGGSGNRRPVQPQEPREKPFSSDEFWSNPDELQKAARQARPRKL